MKRIMKRTLGHFKDLLEHSLRPYEPSPEHILERIVKPICQDARTIRKKGTRNGSWNLIQGLAEECETIFNQSTPEGDALLGSKGSKSGLTGTIFMASATGGLDSASSVLARELMQLQFTLYFFISLATHMVRVAIADFAGA